MTGETLAVWPSSPMTSMCFGIFLGDDCLFERLSKFTLELRNEESGKMLRVSGGLVGQHCLFTCSAAGSIREPLFFK